MSPRFFASRIGYRSPGTDAQPLYITRKSFSGQNDRIEGSRIGDDEASVLTNVDLGVPGKLDKRLGLTLIANGTGTGAYALQSY